MVSFVDLYIISMALLSFCTSVLLANFIGKHKVFAFLSDRAGRFGTLDGLRGYLALAVLFHHFIITWYWKLDGIWRRPPENYYQNFGKVGVALFFMITGFLFFSKIYKDDIRTNWLALYKSRIFRIVPLYLFVVMVISLFVFYLTDFKLQVSEYAIFKQYIRWIIYDGGMINGFSDTRKIIAEVDWTLKYEWLFYMLLPVFAAVIHCFIRLGMAFLFLFSFFFFLYPVDILSINTKYLLLFALGGLCAFSVEKHCFSNDFIKCRKISMIVGGLACSVVFYPNTYDFIHVVLMFLFFFLVVMGNDLFGLFSLKSSVLLGEISYSIYLIHGIVLYAVFSMSNIMSAVDFSHLSFMILMPFITVLVVLCSCLTFIFVEKPGVEIGRHVVFRKKSKVAPAETKNC